MSSGVQFVWSKDSSTELLKDKALYYYLVNATQAFHSFTPAVLCATYPFFHDRASARFSLRRKKKS
jgi:hypothetical protein